MRTHYLAAVVNYLHAHLIPTINFVDNFVCSDGCCLAQDLVRMYVRLKIIDNYQVTKFVRTSRLLS